MEAVIHAVALVISLLSNYFSFFPYGLPQYLDAEMLVSFWTRDGGTRWLLLRVFADPDEAVSLSEDPSLLRLGSFFFFNCEA